MEDALNTIVPTDPAVPFSMHKIIEKVAVGIELHGRPGHGIHTALD
jgi:hypothetical protein